MPWMNVHRIDSAIHQTASLETAGRGSGMVQLVNFLSCTPEGLDSIPRAPHIEKARCVAAIISVLGRQRQVDRQGSVASPSSLTTISRPVKNCLK